MKPYINETGKLAICSISNIWKDSRRGALGHDSKVVHRAYANRALVNLPALEHYEQRASAKTVQSVLAVIREGITTIKSETGILGTKKNQSISRKTGKMGENRGLTAAVSLCFCFVSALSQDFSNLRLR
jgi:hypothetical protein